MLILFFLDDLDGQTVLTQRGSPPGVKHGDRRYLGRPETIESVFYMYRITGDRSWQVSPDWMIWLDPLSFTEVLALAARIKH
jgi:hypothetical protein